MSIDLCTQVLPTGVRCRQAALRGKQRCRHHVRNSEMRRRPLHQQQMDRLRAESRQLSIHDLLIHLSVRLSRIQSAVEAYPEARTLLTIVLERLNEEEMPQSNPQQRSQPSRAAASAPNSNAMQDFLEVLTNQSEGGQVENQIPGNQSPKGRVSIDENRYRA